MRQSSLHSSLLGGTHDNIYSGARENESDEGSDISDHPQSNDGNIDTLTAGTRNATLNENYVNNDATPLGSLPSSGMGKRRAISYASLSDAMHMSSLSPSLALPSMPKHPEKVSSDEEFVDWDVSSTVDENIPIIQQTSNHSTTVSQHFSGEKDSKNGMAGSSSGVTVLSDNQVAPDSTLSGSFHFDPRLWSSFVPTTADRPSYGLACLGTVFNYLFSSRGLGVLQPFASIFTLEYTLIAPSWGLSMSEDSRSRLTISLSRPPESPALHVLSPTTYDADINDYNPNAYNRNIHTGVYDVHSLARIHDAVPDIHGNQTLMRTFNRLVALYGGHGYSQFLLKGTGIGRTILDIKIVRDEASLRRESMNAKQSLIAGVQSGSACFIVHDICGYSVVFGFEERGITVGSSSVSPFVGSDTELWLMMGGCHHLCSGHWHDTTNRSIRGVGVNAPSLSWIRWTAIEHTILGLPLPRRSIHCDSENASQQVVESETSPNTTVDPRWCIMMFQK